MNTTAVGIITLLLIASLSGWFFSHSKKVEKPVKVMFFVLYFWITVFIELVLVAALYKLGLLAII